MTNQDNSIKDVDEKLVSFLVAEYETLRTLRQDYISSGENRFNFFLAILSGTVVFLTWINSLATNASLSREVAYFITIVAIIGVLALGLTTFARITRRNTSISVYTRGMTRIRRYFVDQYSSVEKYIILPIYDDKPAFKPVTTSEQLPMMLGIINGLIASTALAMLIVNINLITTIIVLFISFIVVLFAQLKYYSVRMRKKEEKVNVHFPTPK